MIRHYYTLCKVAEEHQSLKGMLLTECFTQEKNTVIFVFEAHRRTLILECSIDSQRGTLFLKEDFNRARRNTMNLFPELIARPVQSMSIADNERIVTLEFPDRELHCLFFGGGKGNILLTEQGIIRDAFKSPRELMGTHWALPEPSLPSLTDYPPTTGIQNALARSNLLLGMEYALEVCRQLQIAPDTTLSGFTAEEMETIEDAAQAFRERCLASSTFFLLRDARDRLLLSLVPLQGYTEERRFTSISQAIRARISLASRESGFHRQYAALEKQFEASLEKTRRALSAMERESRTDERATERRLYAELLMARPDIHHKGEDSITLENWDGEPLLIPLDRNLTILENAQRYFEKARTGQNAREIRRKRLEQYRHHIGQLEQNLAELHRIQDERQLKQFLETHTLPVMQQKAQQSPFKEFDLGNGYILYVGRNAANNDELTLRFARPNDYWFHARGVSGSHAVLRITGRDKPPKNIIMQAAAIAAYYSKARNAGLTPVAYTQKKYVRKPKGSAPGAVVLEREEVVLVRPEAADDGDE